MNEIIPQNNSFLSTYNKIYRLVAAVFLVSNIIDQNEELKTKIKKISLDLVSLSVNLKDINFYEAKEIIASIEKKSLELMSLIDIASVSGIISEMNGNVLKSEFQAFISELNKFSENSENNKITSVKNVFTKNIIADNIFADNIGDFNVAEKNKNLSNVISSNNTSFKDKNGTNGHKRKDTRKSMILDFIKGHDYVSIKDIVSNITGCSEKTIQRELVQLINNRQIKKTGERRWSKYSLA